MPEVQKYTHYRIDPDGQWWFHDARMVTKSLSPGFYSIQTDPYTGQPFLKPRGTTSDDIVPIPNPNADRAMDIAQRFIRGDFKESLAELGLLNKMAQLLWGEPGTSKSVTVYQIMDYAISQGWVILDGGSYPGLVSQVMKNIRQVQPDLGLVVVWEEFDRLIADYENEILQLLDGSDQLPNVLYVMTTNYIQNVPKRIFTRCRRIPFQVKFQYPGPEERLAYFKAKIPAGFDVDIETWVKKTEGFSIDHCAQALVGVFAYRQTLDEVIDDLKRRMAIYGDGFRMDSEREEMTTSLKSMAYNMGYGEKAETSETPSVSYSEKKWGAEDEAPPRRRGRNLAKRLASVAAAIEGASKVRTASVRQKGSVPIFLS